MRFLASETQCTEDEDRIISGCVGRHFRGSAQALGAGVGLTSTRLAQQRASGPREAHHGMGSHHGRNHSLQRLVPPHGGVGRAQLADTGGDKPRNSEVPGAVDSGGRFQHGD